MSESVRFGTGMPGGWSWFVPPPVRAFISRDFVGHGRWSRLDLGIVPRFDPKEWDLRVDGSVEKPLRLTYDEFLRLPSAKVTSPFHCVTGWTTFDNEWVGTTIREVAERAQIRPTARFATFRCGA